MPQMISVGWIVEHQATRPTHVHGCGRECLGTDWDFSATKANRASAKRSPRGSSLSTQIFLRGGNCVRSRPICHLVNVPQDRNMIYYDKSMN
jgi:hypothetical protein